MRITLIGIDPGVVDTGLVVITLDNETKTVEVHHKVWREVTQEVHKTFIIDPQFLTELKSRVTKLKRANKNTQVFVEGYRNRGRNIKQDQQMSTLVQTISRTVSGSTIVDNTGVKNVVKPALMKLFRFKFQTTNHGDLDSAARIALKGCMQDEEWNSVLSDFVLAAIMDEEPWTVLS